MLNAMLKTPMPLAGASRPPRGEVLFPSLAPATASPRDAAQAHGTSRRFEIPRVVASLAVGEVTKTKDCL